MKILVCVKRVPTVGGAITLTADRRAIDTKASGFTISPHEECPVEEGGRLAERVRGGGRGGGGGGRAPPAGRGGAGRALPPAGRGGAGGGIKPTPSRAGGEGRSRPR